MKEYLVADQMYPTMKNKVLKKGNITQDNFNEDQ